MVNELSERELTILYHIYCYQQEYGIMKGSLERSNYHQVDYICKKTSIDKLLIVALLTRLRRTGLLLTLMEYNGKSDLMMNGVEIMIISPLAEYIKSWVYNAIEGVYIR